MKTGRFLQMSLLFFSTVVMFFCVQCRAPSEGKKTADVQIQPEKQKDMSTDYYEVIPYKEAVAKFPQEKAAFEAAARVYATNKMEWSYDEYVRKQGMTVEEYVKRVNSEGLLLPFHEPLKNLKELKSKMNPKDQRVQIESIDLLIGEIELLGSCIRGEKVFVKRDSGALFFPGGGMFANLERYLSNYGVRCSKGGILGENVASFSPLEREDWAGFVAAGAITRIRTGRLKGAYLHNDGTVILPGLKCFDLQAKGPNLRIVGIEVTAGK
ncbi:MAG: hypothetical protein WAK60_09075 [Sedimentisphaerales bacterium]